MARIFMMDWSKATYYMTAYGIILMLLLVYAVMAAHLYLLGLGFLAMTGFVVWLQWMVIRNNRYIVTEKELIVKLFWTKKKAYLIDKILKIDYVDIGTDWGRNPPNARHQLAIYFDRKYVKSVEPFRFGPVDRDGFVEALLEVNPHIVVDREEHK